MCVVRCSASGQLWTTATARKEAKTSRSSAISLRRMAGRNRSTLGARRRLTACVAPRMVRRMLRVAASAVSAVLLGLVLLFVVYGRSDGLVLEMDRHQPAFVSGLYATERDGETTFAWTSGRMVIRLAGLDRRVDWTCTMRMRGA